MRGRAAPLPASCSRRPVTPRPGQPSGHSAAGSRGSGLSRRLVPRPETGHSAGFAGVFAPAAAPLPHSRSVCLQRKFLRTISAAGPVQTKAPPRPSGRRIKPSPRCPRGPCRWWMRGAWFSSMPPLRAAAFHGIQVGADHLVSIPAALAGGGSPPFCRRWMLRLFQSLFRPAQRAAQAAQSPQQPRPRRLVQCRTASAAARASRPIRTKSIRCMACSFPRALKSPAAAPPGRRRTPPPRPPRSGKRRVPRPPDGSPAPA